MNPLAEILPAAFVFLRSYGFLVTFSTLRQQLGQQVLVTLALGLTAGAYPRWPQLALSTSGWELLINAVLEVASGALLAVPFFLAATVLFSTGRLIDLLRGNLLAEQLLPGLEERTSALEAALTIGLTALLFATGLWELPVKMLYSGFATGGAELISRSLGFGTVSALFELLQLSLRQTVRFLSPAIIVIVAWDAAVFGMSRVQPRLHLSGELAGVKLILGLLALSLANFDPGLGRGLWNAAGAAVAAVIGS